MRGLVNDFLRGLIALGTKWLGLVLIVVQRVQTSIFYLNQKRLIQTYGIASDTPILTFGSELELLIDRAAARADKSARFAQTSGSTAKPKRILYTNQRLYKVKKAYIE